MSKESLSSNLTSIIILKMFLLSFFTSPPPISVTIVIQELTPLGKGAILCPENAQQYWQQNEQGPSSNRSPEQFDNRK